MAAKKPSYNALLRKIERLEAHVQAAHHEQQKARKIANDLLHEMVEYKMRCEQATKLLNGEDV